MSETPIRKQSPAPHISADRVTIEWTQVGDPDVVLDAAVARAKMLHAGDGKHFAGMSVRWDGENPYTMICQIQYDDEGNAR